MEGGILNIYTVDDLLSLVDIMGLAPGIFNVFTDVACTVHK